MSTSTVPRLVLAEQLLDHIDALVRHADDNSRPLELEPYRGKLFELFVTAEGAGYLRAEGEPDLTADGLCRVLAARWGLADATRGVIDQPGALNAENVAQMRLLWSLMRMWMEWTYAWQRWPEFHREDQSSE